MRTETAQPWAEADERGNAAGSVLRSVWKEAEKLFAEDAAPLEKCSICATAICATATATATAGSLPVIRDL